MPALPMRAKLAILGLLVACSAGEEARPAATRLTSSEAALVPSGAAGPQKTMHPKVRVGPGSCPEGHNQGKTCSDYTEVISAVAQQTCDTGWSGSPCKQSGRLGTCELQRGGRLRHYYWDGALAVTAPQAEAECVKRRGQWVGRELRGEELVTAMLATLGPEVRESLRAPLRVASGTPLVYGDADPVELASTTRRHLGAVQVCWKGAAEFREGHPKERVAIFSWVGRRSKLTEAAYLGGDFKSDSAFVSCVLETALSNVSLPAKGGVNDRTYWGLACR